MLRFERGVAVASALVVLVNALGCGGSDGETVCDFRESSACDVELTTGDLLRVKLPEPVYSEERSDQMRWSTFGPIDSTIVVFEEDPDIDTGSALRDEFLFKAVGPGEETINFQENNGQPTPLRTFRANLTVEGDPIDGGGGADYLEGIELAGGFGTSQDSGSSLADLELWPSDLIAEYGSLWVVSDGRLWNIDTDAQVGTIELDDNAAGTAWPSGGLLVSVDPTSNGGFIALISVQYGMAIVKIAPGYGSFEEIYSATTCELCPACGGCETQTPGLGHVRASDDGSVFVALAHGQQVRNDAVVPANDNGATGWLVDASGQVTSWDEDGTGFDDSGRALFWHPEENNLYVQTASGPFHLFGYVGVNPDRISRETDFLPKVLGSPYAYAPVFEMPDGSYWTHSYYLVTDGMSGEYVGRGLYVRRP